ncbi:MAG: alpha-ketoacid dehydrogenase subunit beta [Candidatus Marsarchaeota archaeon]|nr:alpha-ketoacid dehydrogenase subunit beta [Candidatus Marsarchaeota archaeon]MCL5418396.1 alpha-ketoacid dehydrogenase subunit beta [Candidatus Marsarchaeota archaeon]
MQMNMVSALNSALGLILEENANAIILGEDVGKDGGVFRVTDGLYDKFGPDRVVDTPLSESAILGASIGMAIAGLRPLPEIQFAGFMYLSFEQLINHAARFRSRSRGRFKVPMVVRTPVSGGVKALEHHSESPEAFYAHVGGLMVVEPSNPYDAKGLLIRSAHIDDPVVFLEPTRLYRLFKQDVPEDAYEVPIGKASVVKEGDQLSIITYGTMVPVVQAAVEKKNVSADIIDLRTINPLDEETILNSVKKTGRALVVHEAPLSFGVGAEIAARIAEKAMFELSAPVMRVASPSFPYPFPGYEQYYVPNENKVSAAIDKLLSS